jgi:hypothetical protein
MEDAPRGEGALRGKYPAGGETAQFNKVLRVLFLFMLFCY